MGDLDFDRGNVANDVEGVVEAPGKLLGPLRDALSSLFCNPSLFTDADRCKLDTRSAIDAEPVSALIVEEDEDEERRAPLSLFLALINASGVLIG